MTTSKLFMLFMRHAWSDISVRVTHCSLGTVLNTQAYMCFYVKRHLDYKPYEKPSYMKAREAEMIREKEKEKEREKEEAARLRELDDALLATV